MPAPASEQGFTLIESIFTVAIIAIAMTGIIAVWSNAVSRSGDAYLQTKTSTLGAIYLDQIQHLPTRRIVDYQGLARDLDGRLIKGYAEFSVEVKTDFAKNNFKLGETALGPEVLKKIIITLSHGQTQAQQFVVYKQVLPPSGL